MRMVGKVNRRLAAITGVILVALVIFAVLGVQRMKLADRLVATAADEVPNDPTLVKYAHQVAVPAFANTCARCHGADMKGNPAAGVPNLTDKVWLYDQGNVSDIERTILYGIRSGHAKSRNITDMPPIGRLGVLKDNEIRDVIEYVELLSNRPHDAAAAERGDVLFKDRGNCFDCHAPDGTGNPDYGSTDLTANTWTYGGDRETLFKSIRDGRHGKMDAYIGKLSFAQIRALAVDVWERSHRPTQVAEK
jgi:cytochrome c oxidase cbb3-type subunit III